jgi:hypothetical protein
MCFLDVGGALARVPYWYTPATSFACASASNDAVVPWCLQARIKVASALLTLRQVPDEHCRSCV